MKCTFTITFTFLWYLGDTAQLLAFPLRYRFFNEICSSPLLYMGHTKQYYLFLQDIFLNTSTIPPEYMTSIVDWSVLGVFLTDTEMMVILAIRQNGMQHQAGAETMHAVKCRNMVNFMFCAVQCRSCFVQCIATKCSTVQVMFSPLQCSKVSILKCRLYSVQCSTA